MLILAIDQSTSRCSLALARDDRVLGMETWEESASRNQLLFSLLPGLLRRYSVDLPIVDVFAVGLGPGAFSGLRISLSAARAMALPGGKTITGIPSVEALAMDLLGGAEASRRVVVVGDARRDSLWLAGYTLHDGLPGLTEPLGLTRWDDLPARIGEDVTVVSPDWDRIGPRLAECLRGRVSLVEVRRVPSADTLARLAAARQRNGTVSERLAPIYLHPPVGR